MEKAEDRGNDGRRTDEALADEQADAAERAGGPYAAERDGIEDPGDRDAGGRDAGDREG